MKKFKKSNVLCIALFIYVTAMAIYLLPRNTVESELEKYGTVAFSYLIVLALWFVLRKKERLAEQRKRDMDAQNNDNHKTLEK